MKYNELQEMTIENWNGKPFEAYCTDRLDTKFDEDAITINGWYKGDWLDELETRWAHVYPVEWNKNKVNSSKRMTNRQLAKWLAQGNGEWCDIHDNNHLFVERTYRYCTDKTDNPVNENVRVRTWDSEEWVEPTTDLIKEIK